MRARLAIIGNGMATGRLLDELARRGGPAKFEITVFGEEPHGCYNRVLLGRVLGGADAADITLKPRDWYSANGVTLRAGAKVTHVDTAARVLTAADGDTLGYDRLVFATGSAAVLPGCANVRRADGRPKPGVFVFRTVADCERMRAAVRPGADVVVVGGGLLGLEAAKALLDLGASVTVLHRADWLMNTQLDRTAGDLLRRKMAALGLAVRTGVTAAAVVGEHGVEGVRLTTGEVLPAYLVVFACGITPRAELARAAGVPVNRGILVDDTLATEVPGVSAVGECAEHNGVTYGVVEPIWEQCEVLADALTGADPNRRYRGSRVYTRLKVAGVDVASMGLTDAETDADEVVQVIEDRRGVYRKLVVRDGRLVGSMLVGDSAAAPSLVRMLDRGDPLPPNRLDVLTSPLALPTADADPVVCQCNKVTESAIAAAVRTGATTPSAVAACTRAGTGCGSCRGQVNGIIRRHAPQPGAAA